MEDESYAEDILDQDYLFLINFAKTYYACVAEGRDKTLANQWLSKLCSEKVQGISQKRNRNSFLAYFLMNLQDGKMTGPFGKPPEDGPLPEARAIFASSAEPESDGPEKESVIGTTITVLSG